MAAMWGVDDPSSEGVFSDDEGFLNGVMIGACRRVVFTVCRSRKPIVVDNYVYSDYYDATDVNSHPIGSILCTPIIYMVSYHLHQLFLSVHT